MRSDQALSVRGSPNLLTPIHRVVFAINGRPEAKLLENSDDHYRVENAKFLFDDCLRLSKTRTEHQLVNCVDPMLAIGTAVVRQIDHRFVSVKAKSSIEYASYGARPDRSTRNEVSFREQSRNVILNTLLRGNSATRRELA